MLGLDFHVISIFSLHPALYKFTRGSSLFMENLCSWKNQKRKKKQAKRRKKENHSVKKRKEFLCERDWYWRSSTLASIFRTKKSPSNNNFRYIMLKTRFPFRYASTSLDKKTLNNRLDILYTRIVILKAVC